jgi:hypothetical protein
LPSAAVTEAGTPVSSAAMLAGGWSWSWREDISARMEEMGTVGLFEILVKERDGKQQLLEYSLLSFDRLCVG